MRLEERINPYESKKSEATKKIIKKYLLLRQQVNSRLNPYKAETKVYLNDKDLPFKTIHVGDTHIGHEASKVDGLERAVEETKEKGLLVTQGNIIEGVSNKFISTNTTKIGLDLDQQEGFVKEVLRPLDESGQLIMVGANSCHEGWSEKTTTHDPAPSLAGPKTPLLYSGGQIHYYWKGRKVGNVEVYHNPGKGRTQQSPEGSERARSREVPFGHPDKPDAVIGAHLHQLTVAQDVVRSPIDRKDHVTVLGQVGAEKGTRDNPDSFLIGLGVPPRNQPGDIGGGLAMIWKKDSRGKIVSYPVAGYNRANILFEAERLWENAQRTGIMKELSEQLLVNKQIGNTGMILNEQKCEVRLADKAARSEGIAPLYKTVAYDIDTNLPVRINFIGNLRIGSTSFERKKVDTILKDINSNPWAYYFATRRLVNEGISGSPHRLEFLEDMANTFGKAKESILGIMLTDELRAQRWGKSIKRKGQDNKKEIYPGDWLYYNSAIKDTPLIMPETVSFLNLKSNKTERFYTLYIRDKLSHFSSLINPEHGLTRIKQVWGIDADALIGGCTEVVGWRSWMRQSGPLEVVVPGGFSEYTEKGVGSRVDYPTGGQGIIIFPNQKNIYSFATYEDGRDMHQALWLREGYAQLGELSTLMKKLDNK